MKPNKIEWYLGLGSLAIIMDQDRKHWLLKADKTKSTQDPITGASFHGRIMNVGSGINLEVSKLPVDDTVVAEGTFSDENVSNVLSLANSTFPYISKMNGLHFARLTSINLMGSDDSYHNFRLVLKNCVVEYVPITPDKSADTIYSYKWYRTTTAPVLQMLDSNDQFTIEVPITFSDGVTNPVFYYPADEQLQPFTVTSNSNTQCETVLITDPLAIGYPLFWFTCDESNMGPSVALGNISTSMTNPNSQLFEIGHVGDQSQYITHMYPCAGDIEYSAPSTDVQDWMIVCTGESAFTGNDSDFNIGIVTISFKSLSTTTQITITNTGLNTITMSRDVGWMYDSGTGTYQVPLEAFAENAYTNHAPMTSAFDIRLDESIPFETSTTDTGAASLFLSSERTADQLPTYPDDINHLEGLPSWIQNPTAGSTAQHAVLYAAHNTPNYASGNQYTRQIAGLIFDPGMERDYSNPSDGTDIGRVYVVSNDSIVYENNATAEFPKPARTLARMCDIPTSVVQLSGIHGLAPTNVVDKKYVRSQASFTEDDQDQIYNGLRDKWVRPTHLDNSGTPIYQEGSETQSNAFIFDSVENLQRVDLRNHNDFRTISNLNPYVDPTNVSVHSVVEGGRGYQVGNIGIIVVGGFSFTYTVTAVDAGTTGASAVTIAPSDTGMINLSNFDLYDAAYGLTRPYGTSPLSGAGTGLKISFLIENTQLTPVLGSIVDGLYAFVKTNDGIWLYEYKVQAEAWRKNTRVAQTNESDTIAQNGSVSVRDSYIASILPSMREIPVAIKFPRQGHLQLLKTFSTASSINIIDHDYSPASNYFDRFDKIVDINKLYCNAINTATARTRTVEGVIEAIKELGDDRFDSYIFWRWTSNSGLEFEYGVIYRSLNNLMSTDSTSLLPDNDLPTKKFVNTNGQTTVIWNLDKIGPMVWVYDITYTKHETYSYDADTKQIIVSKADYAWKNADVFNQQGVTIDLVDANGKMKYNILTNIPYMIMAKRGSLAWPVDTSEAIYQQPEYQQILIVGEKATNLAPIGGWRMIFPETHSFKFQNGDTTYEPVRMNIVRGSDFSSVTDVLDIDDDNANYSTMLLDVDPSTHQPRLQVYNPDEQNPGWVKV